MSFICIREQLEVNIRKAVYFGASGFIVFLALATITCWLVSIRTDSPIAGHIANFTGIPLIFLYPPGTGLTWFAGQSLKIAFKRRLLVYSCLGLSGLLWAYLFIVFFFRSITPEEMIWETIQLLQR
jgi:hypothetical protein